MLWSITPDVAGAHGMFTRLQHALQQARGSWVHISLAIHNKLSAWHQLVQDLANQLTHLREIDPFNPTWEDATDTSGTGMGGVCKDP